MIREHFTSPYRAIMALQEIAARLADALPGDLPEFSLDVSVQFSSHREASPEADRIAAVDVVAAALVGGRGAPHAGSKLYSAEGEVSGAHVDVFTGIISPEEVRLRQEVETLRARADQLAAQLTAGQAPAGHVHQAAGCWSDPDCPVYSSRKR